MSKDFPVVIAKEIDVVQCSCKSTDPNPCGTNDCINRSTLMECDPKNCLTGDKCQNQRFQKRQYKGTKIVKTDSRGWGLITTENIKKGEFVLEYVGEIITHEEYRKRSGELQAQKSADFYFLYLDNRRMIDARPMGNYARFINHSCNPNCVMEKWVVCGDSRVGIFALKDIIPGEELTFDYQSEKYDILQECNCNSENCRGVIGKKGTDVSKSATKKLKKTTISSDHNHLSIKTNLSSLEQQIVPSTSNVSPSDSFLPASHCSYDTLNELVTSPNSSTSQNSLVSLYSKPFVSLFSEQTATVPITPHLRNRLSVDKKPQKMNSKLSRNSHLSETSSSSSSVVKSSEHINSFSNSNSIGTLDLLSSTSLSFPTPRIRNWYLDIDFFKGNVERDQNNPKRYIVDRENTGPVSVHVDDIIKMLGGIEEIAAKLDKIDFMKESLTSIVLALRKSDSDDDYCFICKHKNDLLSCSRKDCYRAYHLFCVGLPSIPNGEWHCPSHVCRICGNDPSFICENCPTSFCKGCLQRRVPSKFYCQICEIKKKNS